jgi:hypothetical protein
MYDRYGNFKPYTKSQLTQGLTQFVTMKYGGYPQLVVKLDDCSAPSFKHACVRQGLILLNKQVFPVPEMGLEIPYYVCPQCGRLYYAPDSLETY